mmetsp:Transcript_14473/g.12747  ORF Transcript_14473/g.12747 Transcript_14473/m.12747 type:complete len:193 (-) Transcript_14473:24-602(-)
MKYDNHYDHKTPWKRSKRLNNEFIKSPYFFTGDERLSVMHREVHLLPRSYRSPKDKAPFLNPKKSNNQFPEVDHNYMTNVGKMLLRKGKKNFSSNIKRLEELKIIEKKLNGANRRQILEHRQRNAPKWSLNANPREKTFTPYSVDNVHVVSESDRYGELKSHNSTMNLHHNKQFNKYSKGRNIFSVEHGTLI